MDINYKTRSQAKAGFGEGRFLITNKKGGYLFLAEKEFSHFTGLFYFIPEEWTLYKTISDIRLETKPTSITNHYHSIKRRTKKAEEEFFFFGKTLYYEVKDYQGKIIIDLDMRRIYDNDTRGRIFKIYWEEGNIIVEYMKYKDDEHKELQEKKYLIIKGVDRYTLLNQWEPRNYKYDEERGEQSERWVYKAISMECEENLRISFTFGNNKEEVIKDSNNNWNDWELIKTRLKKYYRSVKTNDEITCSTAVFALDSMVMSLNNKINRTGIFAGLPWFFQFWSRDELISLKALMLTEKYSLVKEIIILYTNYIMEDGRLPNRIPESKLGSADSIGWLWKRLGDFITILEKEKLLYDYFSEEELEYLLRRIEESIKKQVENYYEEGLIINREKETWMDTDGGTNDKRGGARIEIQALMLASIKTYQNLQRILKKGNGKEMKELKEKIIRAVRKKLYDGRTLYDGIINNEPDKTIRPNIFIAAYAYQELFTKKEWKTIIKNSLKKLWLEWGGLSTIDKNHELYCERHTGINDKSYHRGDSWYFINNIAAIVMHKIDEEEFKYYIKSIKKASSNELLWMGINGHAAEISSAKEQKSQGSLSQAWSAATLIELLSIT